MGFRLFGVNVEVQIGFWVMAFFFGWGGGGMPTPQVLVWMLVVFVSVLVHEYGHAFAMRRFRLEPEITLHWMGGATSWGGGAPPTGRRDRIFISLAGPFAGFAFGGIIFAAAWVAGAHPRGLLIAMLSGAGSQVGGAFPPLVRETLGSLMFVNFYWGLINLAPVLPLDGGHVLEHALGPARLRITALISCVVGAALCTYFLIPPRNTWGAMLFGIFAFMSFQRWREAKAPVQVLRPRPAPARAEQDLAPDLAEALRLARQALDDERFDEAIAHASDVLAGQRSGRAAESALSVIAWAHLLAGRTDAAQDALTKIRKLGEADAALVGAVARARGHLDEARRAFEAARTAGDDRKEVVGPLIQILIEQGEVARAADVAHDIVESLSEDDARRMAGIAFEAAAFSGAARLYEAVFQREGQADDAYEAARARAQAGEHDKALELLRRAVEAGFSDRARAWSDAALEALRTGDHLEAVLPRP